MRPCWAIPMLDENINKENEEYKFSKIDKDLLKSNQKISTNTNSINITALKIVIFIFSFYAIIISNYINREKLI